MNRVENRASICMTCNGYGTCHSPSVRRTDNGCRQSWDTGLGRSYVHHGCSLPQDHDGNCRCVCAHERPVRVPR